MRRKGWYLALSLGILLVTAPVCHLSTMTGNISSLKLGKNKSVSQQADNFAPQDTIYAVTVISGVSGAVQVKGRLVVEDVPGINPGPIRGLEATVNLPGNGPASFEFSAPTKGWPKGKYQLEILLLNENGEQVDKKAASFMVS